MRPLGACGVQVKAPVTELNSAPAGRLSAASVRCKPPGSTAEKVKATGFPNAVNSLSGSVMTGAVAGVTVTEPDAVVCPNCTEIVEDCCLARGSVKTSKATCACPGRVLNESGSARLAFSLLTARRAICRTLGVFSTAVHMKELPAVTVSGEHDKLVGRIPRIAMLADVNAPCTDAVICT
jgi:hypothetical protein